MIDVKMTHLHVHGTHLHFLQQSYVHLEENSPQRSRCRYSQHESGKNLKTLARRDLDVLCQKTILQPKGYK